MGVGVERTFSPVVDELMSDGGTDGGKEGTRRWRDAVRPGVIGSLVLHVAALGLLLYQVGVPPVLLSVIPVELVQLAEQTATPAPQPDAARQRARLYIDPQTTEVLDIVLTARPPAPCASDPSGAGPVHAEEDRG